MLKQPLLEKMWEISLNSQKNICAGISSFVFSCEFCEICKNIFFLKKSTGRLIIAVSIVAKGVLANETINYDTKIKAYALTWARSVSY